MLRTRAQIDAQPRTMQFVIERPCNYTSPEKLEKLSAKVPFAVFVEFPSDGKCWVCGKSRYRVTSASVRWVERIADVNYSGYSRHVCETEGGIIE